MLDNLTLSLEGECEEMLEEYGLSRVGVIPQFPVPPQWQSAHVRERAAILKSMQETDTCGECQWCQALRLRDRCDGILEQRRRRRGLALQRLLPAPFLCRCLI